jgi:hypothetical protein
MNTQETNQAQQLPEVAAVPPAPVAAPVMPMVTPVMPVAAPFMPVAAPATRRVSPGLALFLSFFPGLGHLYLGMYRRAVAVFLAFAIAIWLSDHGDLGIIIPFVIFFAVIDAYRQAQFINSGVPVEVETPIVGKGGRKSLLGFGVFLAVMGLFLLYNNFYPVDFSFMRDWWPLLLVLGGIWMVGSHFWEKKKQEDADNGLSQQSI